MDKKYQVFVSSTYEDLKVERAAVFSCLLDNNCIPVGMEQFPASPLSQWAYITKMIDISDYYLLIIAGRYGSIDPDVDMSYTEKEFHYAQEKGIPILAFLHQHPENIPFAKSEQNDFGREKLNAFRQTVQNSGIHVNYYNDENELKCKIGTSITKTIADCPAIGWVRADQVEKLIQDSEYVSSIKELQNSLSQMQSILSDKIDKTAPTWEPISKEAIQQLFEETSPMPSSSTPNLSKEAKQLLGEACSDPSGQILKIRTLSGVSITTNQKEMLPDNNGRTVAIWEAALEELLHYHMITALGTKGEVFQLTKYGYDHNDLLQKHHGWIF